MKDNRWIGGLAAGVAFSLCQAATAFGQIIVYSQDFEAPTYNPGSIVGQDSWFRTGGSTTSSEVRDGPAGTLNTSQVLGSTANSGEVPVVNRFVTCDFQGEPEGILRFDFYRDLDAGPGTYTGVGLVDNSGIGVAFMVSGSGTITYRQAIASGFTFDLTDIDGANLAVIQSTNWFRFEARFNLADNTIAKVTIQNLTTGADPVRGYFGANTPSVWMTNQIANWARLTVRTANSNHHNVYFDNIQIVATPEPGPLYVAPDGCDTNPGTDDAPVRTLEKARDIARAIIAGGLTHDLTVRIRPGVYALSETLIFDSRDSGTSEHSVIYEAADPENPPIITGGQPIEGTWTQEAANLWTIVVPGVAEGQWWFRDLFRGDERQIRARSPNVPITDGITIGQPMPSNDPDYPNWIRPVIDVDLLVVSELLNTNRTSFRVTGPAFPEVFPSDNAEIVTIGPWNSTRAHVREASNGQIDTYQRPGREGLYWCDLMRSRPLYLEHAKAFLDMEGEWFLEQSTGKLYLVSSTNPNDDSFWVPRLERLITVMGTSGQPVVNFQFRNLVIKGSSWNLPEGNYIASQAHFYREVGFQWPVELPEAIRFQHAHSAVVSGCRIAHTGASALAFGRGCRDGRILNNTFEDIGATAIHLGDNIADEKHGDDNGKAIRLRVSHNEISRYGRTHFGAVGIWQAFCPYSIIEYNKIHDAPYTAISMGWDWSDIETRQRGVIVRHNHIFDVLKVFDDGAGIYALGAQGGALIYGNRIHDIINGNGLQLDNGSSDLIAENNLIYRVAKKGVMANMGYNRIVRNNIFADANIALITLRQIGHYPGETVVQFERNIYYFSSPSALIGREGNQTLYQMNTVFDSNLYWAAAGQPLIVDGGSFAAWQASGRDTNSVTHIEPLFADKAGEDFTLLNAGQIHGVIGFATWDQSLHGPLDIDHHRANFMITRFSPSINGGGLNLAWNSLPGFLYEVWHSTGNLDDWQRLEGHSITADFPASTVTVPKPGATSVFYRVLLRDP